MIEPKIEETKVVDKKWGHEEIYVNNEFYCLKRLVFYKGAQFSYHLHHNKRETWICDIGSLELLYKDLSNGLDKKIILNCDSLPITIPPFLPHQLKALEYSEIWEVSTKHEDSDSYRIGPGDSQNGVNNGN